MGPDRSRRGRCLPEEGRCRVPPRRRQHCDPEAPPWRQSLSVTRRRCELPRAPSHSQIQGEPGSTEFDEVNCSANQGHTQNMINAARKRRSLVTCSQLALFGPVRGVERMEAGGGGMNCLPLQESAAGPERAGSRSAPRFLPALPCPAPLGLTNEALGIRSH